MLGLLPAGFVLAVVFFGGIYEGYVNSHVYFLRVYQWIAQAVKWMVKALLEGIWKSY